MQKAGSARRAAGYFSPPLVSYWPITDSDTILPFRPDANDLATAARGRTFSRSDFKFSLKKFPATEVSFEVPVGATYFELAENARRHLRVKPPRIRQPRPAALVGRTRHTAVQLLLYFYEGDPFFAP